MTTDKIGYNVKFNFGNLVGAEVEQRQIEGVTENVLVIPMRINGIYQSRKYGDRGIFAWGNAAPYRKQRNKDTHYLRIVPPEEIRKERMELGFYPCPFFGNMRETFHYTNTSEQKGSFGKLDEILFGDF